MVFFKGLYSGWLQPCLQILGLGCKVIDSDKHSSLLQHEIVYGRKKFYDTGPHIYLGKYT
jgi:hypothetical protein